MSAAEKYRPKHIKLLLVAESPPSEDERYFYAEDTAGDEPLFAEIAKVLFEGEPAGEKAPYLKELRRRGVFVTELKPDAPRAGEPLGPYVPPFLINVETLAPDHIVLIGAGVHAAALAALQKAGLPVVDVKVPLAPSGEQAAFRQAFRQALVRAQQEKLIRPLRTSKEA